MSTTDAPADLPRAGRHHLTPAELFDLDSSPDILTAWHAALDRIEESERAANDDDSISVH